MRFQNTLSLLSIAAVGVAAQGTTGELGDAPVVKNNPPGVVYSATLPESAFTKTAYPEGGNAKGSISAVASPDGVGVIFKVSFSNLPKEGGPFTYHLHNAPVPANGNCTAANGHIDPYLRKDDPPCDSKAPQTCEVGDLSGKHGKITSDPFEASYTDPYASTLSTDPAYFGNLSFVLHFANKTRISCANFVQAQAGPTPVPTDNCTTTTTTKVPIGTGGATSVPTQSSIPIAGASLVSKSAAVLGAGVASLFAAAFLL